MYQTEYDELRLIEEALAAGCQIVPDSDYETPEVRVIDTVQAFQHFRLEQRHFFISHASFSRLPLVLRPISRSGKVFYYISPSQGGPFLEFMGGGIVESGESGMRYIRSGFLAFSSEYWDEQLTTKQAAPSELVQMYESLSKVIRTFSTRIKPDKSVFWLGNDAKVQLLNGTKLGLHQGWSFPS